MASRKGLLPVTPALLAQPELTLHLANIEQDKTPSAADNTELYESPTFKAIRDDLIRLIASSAGSERAPGREPLADSVTRFVPASSIPSSSSSRASSRVRDELRADMRRVVAPSNLPATSQKVTASHWPKGNLLHEPGIGIGHSRNSSDASNSSLALDKVPQLSPSKSESRFDTTSTRHHITFVPTPAEEKKPERALYGPLEIDEDCFSVDSEFNRAPNVIPVETTKNNPMLFSNIIKKTDAVFTGDPVILDLPEQIDGCGFWRVRTPSSYEIREKQARRVRLQRKQEAMMWQQVQAQAAQHQLEAEALNEQKMAEHLHAQAALREQYAIAEQWREQNKLTAGLKAPPGLSGNNGLPFASDEHNVAQQHAIEDESFEEQLVAKDEPKSISTLTTLLHSLNSASASDGSQQSWATYSESSESPSAHNMPVRQIGGCEPSNIAHNDGGSDGLRIDRSSPRNRAGADEVNNISWDRIGYEALYGDRSLPLSDLGGNPSYDGAGGLQDNGFTSTGDRETYNSEGSCAIESCSTFCQDANGRRYF